MRRTNGNRKPRHERDTRKPQNHMGPPVQHGLAKRSNSLKNVPEDHRKIIESDATLSEMETLLEDVQAFGSWVLDQIMLEADPQLSSVMGKHGKALVKVRDTRLRLESNKMPPANIDLTPQAVEKYNEEYSRDLTRLASQFSMAFEYAQEHGLWLETDNGERIQPWVEQSITLMGSFHTAIVSWARLRSWEKRNIKDVSQQSLDDTWADVL